jgi:hypothetical protein
MSTVAELLALAPGAVGTLTSPATITRVGKMDTAKNGQPWALLTIADHTGASDLMWMPCAAEVGFSQGKTVLSIANGLKADEYNGKKRLRAEGANALVISVAAAAPAQAAAGGAPAAAAPARQHYAPPQGRQPLGEAAVLAFVGRTAGPLAVHLWTGIAEALMPPAARRGPAALEAALDGGAKYAPTPDALLAAVQATLCTMLIAAGRGELTLEKAARQAHGGNDDIPW